jgi:glycosyltransferase involved in cell wall biosynthesis
VVFTGRVPHDQVQTSYYDLLDVLVYPRLSMRLTDLVTPLKPLEAMAQGRILAASDVGGHLELITDGKTGVLFRADDTDRAGRQGRRPAGVAADIGRRCGPGGRATTSRHERNWPASVARYKTCLRQADRPPGGLGPP